jgi:hypothetical protein
MVSAARLEWVVSQLLAGRSASIRVHTYPDKFTVNICLKATTGVVAQNGFALLLLQGLIDNTNLACVVDHGHKKSNGESHISLLVKPLTAGFRGASGDQEVSRGPGRCQEGSPGRGGYGEGARGAEGYQHGLCGEETFQDGSRRAGSSREGTPGASNSREVARAAGVTNMALVMHGITVKILIAQYNPYMVFALLGITMKAHTVKRLQLSQKKLMKGFLVRVGFDSLRMKRGW